ncbi:TetR/AcrR family transcriptional regulator [Paraburkholderia sp. JHI2823]|uniref:TetR/AcrR family transcriptional regulator n=1 Tax=Paraburkholderia sp. JHI2823 TaxID=3112960 RepID=UPI003170F6E6
MKTGPAIRPSMRRRKPRQSRAHQTSWALQEAFVRLLMENDYEAITIHNIVDLAGTGLGSFYDYFANKDDLARVCVHLRTEVLLKTLKDAPALVIDADVSLERAIQATIDRLLTAHADHPAHWGVHYLLERRFSGLSAYAPMYERFVLAWERILQEARADLAVTSNDVARTCQTIAYGLIAHAHIRHLSDTRHPLDQESLRRSLNLALLGYLNSVSCGANNSHRR